MKFLLIDRITELVPGERIRAVKALSLAEEYLADHFPRFPVMPGVLQLEAISQVASWLAFVSSDFKMKGTLSELGTIKFKDFVKPGDQMIIEVFLQSSDSEGITFKATVKVNDKVKTTLTSARLRYIPVEELEDPVEAQEYFDYLSGEKPFGVYLH